ncbi:MAG: filamentous hemagglutinin N-terminal domain-containing protein [Rhizobiales bacterium]|nr:filamentous hemagglutinin N-terminal domain-containing protein [Hyphomicrobiales bacterium]
MTMTAMAALMVLSRPVLAGPVGGTVVDGAAAISQAGTATNINQPTNKAIINWQGFSVGANESVNFYQPGASSVTLNRVIGNETSVINGAINANGQVFIVNSAGVLFGKGSQVNVGGLVVSTHDISNSDFMAGNYTFSGTSNAAVINQGRIRAHSGGYVALLGKTVSNDGVISARLGTVAMSAGERLTLNFEGNSLLDVTIDKGALNALVENKRAIIADGGRVILTARAADQLLAAQVNNTGIVQARTVAALKGGSVATGRKGRRTTPKVNPNPNPEADPADVPMAQGSIKIYAYSGTANIAGTLDASAPKGGDGGFIETSGDVVNVADSAFVTTKAIDGRTGTWLIDPNDFTIAASGGNMTGAAVASALANNNYEIKTATMGTPGGNGDIFVNDAITWSSNYTLTLTAERNVTINKAITAEGLSAGLTLNAGNNININNAVKLKGANAALVMNYGGYNGTTVTTPLAGTDYIIRTKASYAGVADEMGPIYDNNGKPVLDGDGNQLLGPVAKKDTSGGVYGSITLAHDGASTLNGAGLTINGQTYTLIHNLDQWATTGTRTGNYALAESIDATAWSSANTGKASVVATFSGTLAGLGHVVSNLTLAPTGGVTGLIGTAAANATTTIRDIGVTNLDYSGGGKSGGLIGVSSGVLKVSQAYAAGRISSTGATGGLIGDAGTGTSSGTVSDSYASVNIESGSTASVKGGLVGQVRNIQIIRSQATGDMIGGGAQIGGLVGNVISSTVSQSYATGDVSTSNTTSSQAGGLIGVISNVTAGTINAAVSDSFATGDVTAATRVGGLIGYVNMTAAKPMIIDRTWASGKVTATYSGLTIDGKAGGLIGEALYAYITDAHASGDVELTGSGGTFTYAGGLVGRQFGGFIQDSSASGNVTGGKADSLGGLVGSMSEGNITNSHASGNVASYGLNIGGLAGGFGGTGPVSVTGSSASGSVTGNAAVGGLLGGFTGEQASVVNSSATGNVSAVPRPDGWRPASSSAGGLIGLMGGNGGDVVNSTATGSVTGIDGPVGLVGQQVNGTIDSRSTYTDVAAIAAAERAAFRADAVRTGSTVASTGGDVASSGATPPATASSIRAMQHSAKLGEVDDGLKQTERHARDDDRRHEQRRKAAIAAATRETNAPRAPSYRGTIRSIEVDGQRFELERDDTPSSGGSNSGAPASSGGAQ